MLGRILFALLAFCAFAYPCAAQIRPATTSSRNWRLPHPPPVFPFIHNRQAGGMSFADIARPAGLIFAGTVLRIEHHAASQSLETVAITFHVDEAIRGTAPGDDLTVSQWIGLWSRGQRYRVGERVLLFLYPPSKVGLTSCVSSPLGRFSLDASGRVLLSALHAAAFQQDPVLGGKSRVRFSDFALAVRRATEEE